MFLRGFFFFSPVDRSRGRAVSSSIEAAGAARLLMGFRKNEAGLGESDVDIDVALRCVFTSEFSFAIVDFFLFRKKYFERDR